MDEHNQTSATDGIAIVGMSGRFPGAKDLDQFWHNLVNGVDSVARLHEEDLEYSVATKDAIAQGQKFIRARGVIEGADLFDAEFFGMYPREAQLIDPQHRLFLECAWEALESAGHAPELPRTDRCVRGPCDEHVLPPQPLCGQGVCRGLQRELPSGRLSDDARQRQGLHADASLVQT